MANPHPDMSGLRKFGSIPEEEHKRMAANGGRASGETKRRKKNLREVTRALLEASALPDTDPELLAALEAAGLDKDNQGVMMLAAMRKSQAGDIEASRFVRDTSGQAPSQQVELGGIDGKPIEVMDLSNLTTEQLNALLAVHQDDGK
jgi:hypothetical protein